MIKDIKEREFLAIKYQPLVHKIANQWMKKLPLSSDDIVGFAELGLVQAINTYDPEKTGKRSGKKGTQSFRQYAAWCMLHSILNGSNNEGHIVKLSAYHQKKRKSEGENAFIMKSIDMTFDDDGESRLSIPEMSAEDPYIGVFDVYNRLYDKIEDKFNERDCDIFYRVFGLKGKEKEQGKKLAKEYNIANCTVTLITNKIIAYIKKDQELCDELYELMR